MSTRSAAGVLPFSRKPVPKKNHLHYHHRRMQQRRVDGSQRMGCVRRQQEESTRLVVRWFSLKHL